MKAVPALFLVAVLAALPARAGSAAEPAGNGRILLIERGDLFTVTPDGDDRRRLTFDGRNVRASFSPNGERIAFLKSDGFSPRSLYVMNADGSSGARLIASHPESRNAGGIHAIAWSPDSRRLAYALGLGVRPSIRVVDAEDGTRFPLPQAGEERRIGDLEWSPDGGELLYDSLGDVYVKPLDGGPARLLANFTGTERSATWSPDGTRVAFVHSLEERSGGIYVVRRDGTDVRHVAATGTALLGTVRWRPDGTAVVFDATVVKSTGPRNPPLTTTRVLVAGTEGATIGVLRDHVAEPVPSPDNGQILIGRALKPIWPGYEAIKPGAYAMNADGTCLTLLTTGTAVGWQPRPATPVAPRRECVDLALGVTASRAAGMSGFWVVVAVVNEGTLAATEIDVRIAVDRPVRFFDGALARRCTFERSTATCRIDRIDPGQTFAASISARPFAPTRLNTTVTVSPAEREADPANNESTVSTRVYPCWISGSDLDDRLEGTHVGERICGRAGNDVIDGLAGNDVIEGGWHEDTLVGGDGRDRLVGGRGDDVILARDGERDVVDCGLGLDRAFADRIDRVLRGCEEIHRR